jgi:hypothetical protein
MTITLRSWLSAHVSWNANVKEDLPYYGSQSLTVFVPFHGVKAEAKIRKNVLSKDLLDLKVLLGG